MVLALPLIVGLSILMQIMMEFQIVGVINTMMSPITVFILGLPAAVGIYLFYGVLRKELNLVLLEMYILTVGMTMLEFMSPIQMITFTLVTMLYVPCLATVVVIGKEAGKKFATHVFLLELLGAIVIAATVRWSFELLALIFPSGSEFTIMFATFVFLFGLMILSIHIIKKHSLRNTQKHGQDKAKPTITIQENLLDHSGCQSCKQCNFAQSNEKSKN